MARASTRTLLALDRWAAILGLNPAHFNQGAGATYFPASGPCSNVFYQYAWQRSDAVSREDIARAIRAAEEDIAAFLGFWPAPEWVEEDVKNYPQYHRRDLYQADMTNLRGMNKAVRAQWGKFIQPGQRAVSVVQAGAAVVYSDADADGYQETATITVATSLTDKCEIKVFFAGHDGEPEWEIRPARTVTLTGGNIVFTFYAWQLIPPALWEAFPTTADTVPINIELVANRVTTVDVYREYNDYGAASCQLWWEPTNINLTIDGLCSSCGGSGCAVCAITYQDGCLHVRDVDLGYVVPTPGTYDSDSSTWAASSMTICRDPDMVKLWYQAGDVSQDWIKGRTCDPLDRRWAEAITWLAVARLERPFCTCGAAAAMAIDLMTDVTMQNDKGSFQVSDDDLNNPFGTRKGEIKAWRIVGKLSSSMMTGGAI